MDIFPASGKINRRCRRREHAALHRIRLDEGWRWHQYSHAKPRIGQYDSMLAYFDGVKYGKPVNEHYVEAKLPPGYSIKKTNLGYKHLDPNGEGVEYSLYDKTGNRISTSFDRMEFGKRITWTDVNQDHYQKNHPGNFRVLDDSEGQCSSGNCKGTIGFWQSILNLLG